MRRIFHWFGAAIASAALLSGCGDPGTAPSSEIFVDRAVQSGIDFVHVNGMSGEFYFHEMMGSGGALFDYDNDGDLDVYLVQGHALKGAESVAENARPRDILLRNDLAVAADGQAMLTFTDVTEASGIDSRGYGMGVTVADIDNDGWLDLYVTNYGSNHLWRNLGPGDDGSITFDDITEAAGVDDPRWSTSAVFLDYDRDGWLDLYVLGHSNYRIDDDKACADKRGSPDYCGPLAYQPIPDRLFRNLGESSLDTGSISFEDVSLAAGILVSAGYGLGVVAADFNGDGWIDIYAANDQSPNHQWMNQGGRLGFLEDALISGSAVDSRGRSQASMGVDVGDIDGDGNDDIFLTHLLEETNTLYLSDSEGRFRERTMSSGLASPSMGFTGFGTAMIDVDNDGWLDLIAVNGAVRRIHEQVVAGDPHPLRQTNQLFRNVEGSFSDWSDQASILASLDVSRGLAAGDIDNDGDPDVLIVNNDGPAQLLINELGQDNQWLGLRLVGDSGRDMLGARVGLIREGQKTLWRRVRADGSYLSSQDPRVVFGLGDSSCSSSVIVRWPSGGRERFTDLECGRYQTLVEGSGSVIAHGGA